MKPEDSPVCGDGTAPSTTSGPKATAQRGSQVRDRGNQPQGTQDGRSERDVGHSESVNPPSSQRTQPEETKAKPQLTREQRQAESRKTRENTEAKGQFLERPYETDKASLPWHRTDSSHCGRKGKRRHQHRPYRSGKVDRREPRVLNPRQTVPRKIKSQGTQKRSRPRA